MKWVGICVGVFCALVVAMTWLGSARAHATSVSFSQSIRPLVCTVDIVKVGASVTVSLSPAECTHSGAARALFAQTKASFGHTAL